MNKAKTVYHIASLHLIVKENRKRKKVLVISITKEHVNNAQVHVIVSQYSCKLPSGIRFLSFISPFY